MRRRVWGGGYGEESMGTGVQEEGGIEVIPVY